MLLPLLRKFLRPSFLNNPPWWQFLNLLSLRHLRRVNGKRCIFRQVFIVLNDPNSWIDLHSVHNWGLLDIFVLRWHVRWFYLFFLFHCVLLCWSHTWILLCIRRTAPDSLTLLLETTASLALSHGWCGVWRCDHWLLRIRVLLEAVRGSSFLLHV